MFTFAEVPAESPSQKKDGDAKKVTDGKQIDEKLEKLFDTYKSEWFLKVNFCKRYVHIQTTDTGYNVSHFVEHSNFRGD